MDFSPKPGCPMCSIVAQPYPSLLHSPRSPSFGPPGTITNSGGGGDGPAHIIYKDDKVTAYLERNNPVSSKGHVVIMLNLHVPSIYAFSSSDLSLLTHLQQLGNNLLTRHMRGDTFSSINTNPVDQGSPSAGLSYASPDQAEKIHVGFIVSPFSDPKIPVKDHVHCHAYVGEMDLAGWWRKVNYSGLAWYAAEDLIAEIREQTSNNRIKSGYTNRPSAPIDRVPDAGAAAGYADGTGMLQSPVVPGTGNLQVPARSGSSGGRPSVTVPIIQDDGLVDGTDPSTPKPGDTMQTDLGVPKIAPVQSSRSSSSSAAGKRPMGPRHKDSMNTNSMQMGSVGSSPSGSTPELVPTA
ncbi:hypothetical protein FRB94_009004 [Tulasnella sp. JGI-2019a]|nr:hypothetical protein FRB93_003467 [Tulasnella sp. JGI-2019a]KAG9014846.1 hypothetical protein FRB94_009004 [Tulasnella sp. JGI-2019a]KAG9039994.1 hypothetical protein FRB95_004466 [Tulasnella sp. JGI-2019a]